MLSNELQEVELERQRDSDLDCTVSHHRESIQGHTSHRHPKDFTGTSNLLTFSLDAFANLLSFLFRPPLQAGAGI